MERNEFIAARMYAMDVEYTNYEDALTREGQDVGFLAAVTNAGLTGAGAAIPLSQTTKILSAVAAGLTTVHVAYNTQFLLNKTVQILQAQMRSKRAEISTRIIARTKDPVTVYPLGMAMSDLEEYYRAGTLTGALVDVSTAVSQKEFENKAENNAIKPGAQSVE